MKYKYLTLSDRIEIELGTAQGFSFRESCKVRELSSQVQQPLIYLQSRDSNSKIQV